MAELAVICEGKTERLFCEEVLRPHLARVGIRLMPIEIGIDCLSSGGNVTFARVLHDAQLLLCDYEKVTTLVDYFKLGKGWSGLSDVTMDMSSDMKACTVEAAAIRDAVTSCPTIDMASRFMPNVLMHEFEGLLFSEPSAIVEVTRSYSARVKLEAVAQEFKSPEDINTGRDSAPSKRLHSLGANYGKITHGARIAMRIGLENIRVKCPHFNRWLTRIEELG